MSAQTKAFVHEGDWDAETRKHPALKWFEPIVRDVFDAHLWDTPSSEFYVDDVKLLKPDGTEITGSKEAWAEVAQLYGPFTSQRSQLDYVVITETDYGWEMLGNAYIFGNLPGNPGPNEPGKVRDVDGKEWDCKMIGGFRFQFVKDAGGPRDPGILLKMVQITTDTAPVMVRMIGRGLVKPSDLGL